MAAEVADLFVIPRSAAALSRDTDVGTVVPVHSFASDLVTVGLLIVLETLLSADNALVMAVIALGLPPHARKRALNFGMIGSLVLRVGATLLAIYLIQFLWLKALGGAYLLFLTGQHFTRASRIKPIVTRRQRQKPSVWPLRVLGHGLCDCR